VISVVQTCLNAHRDFYDIVIQEVEPASKGEERRFGERRVVAILHRYREEACGLIAPVNCRRSRHRKNSSNCC
jgi:hypothetical protein